MEGPVLLDGVFALLTAAVYMYIGRVLMSRRAAGEVRTAAVAFATWWIGLGIATVLTGSMRVLAGFGLLTFEMLAATMYLVLLPISIAMWGLMYYLVFVLTGNAKWRTPLALAYAAFYAACVGYIAWRQPVGLEVDGFTLTLVYAREANAMLYALVLAILVPQLVAAAGYLALLTRVRERTQRYRISLVAGSVLAWFGSVLFASEVGLSDTSWWPIASRAIGLAAALTILAAYRPPSWVRTRFGIRSMRDEAAEAG